jgi:pimeloyl-ACP methyl ester carboxylesterase
MRGKWGSKIMANFLLLHGAWHWGGCFQKLAEALQAAGHQVAAPDLASHGYEPTLPQEVKDIAQYTAPARRILEAAKEPVVLLGHSMGGVSCSYLAEQCPEKISAVVYLAAFMLPRGKFMHDYSQADDTEGALIRMTPEGLELDISQTERLKEVFYGDCSAHDVAIAAQNIRRLQTTAPLIAPCPVTTRRYGQLRRVYVECTQDRILNIETQRRMQADMPGTEVFTLETSHSPFFSGVAELAGILERLVGAVGIEPTTS